MAWASMPARISASVSASWTCRRSMGLTSATNVGWSARNRRAIGRPPLPERGRLRTGVQAPRRSIVAPPAAGRRGIASRHARTRGPRASPGGRWSPWHAGERPGHRSEEAGMASYDYLIVGGGMTADAAARGIRERDSKGTIGIIGAESHPPYNRPPLTKGLWKG